MNIIVLLASIVAGLIGLAIPIATLVGVFLTYGKVRRIEEAMNQRGQGLATTERKGDNDGNRNP